ARYQLDEDSPGAITRDKVQQLRSETDITIITTGIMVSEGLIAANILEEQGHSTRVLHFPTIKPLDKEAIIAAAKETKGIVTVEEHSIIGGLGEAVAGVTGEAYPCMDVRAGVMDTLGESGEAYEQLDKYGLRAKNIVEAAQKIFENRNNKIDQ